MSGNNDKAFEIVFREHHRMVTAYLHSLLGNWADAAEMTQETFKTAYARIDSFDTTRPVGPWLRGIARNLALNFHRKHARRPEFLQDTGVMEAVYALFDEPRGDEAWEARLQAMDTCIERLPEQQRSAVRLHYGEDESAKSIAVRLSVTEKTIFQTLWRARLNLKLCIETLLRGGQFA
jgi:RNA polymerase sigma-70 factor (ECF subfamily)